MQVKKIFLASSAELKEDRRAFALMLAQLNQKWRVRDYTFDLVVWEDFIDAMAPAGLQSKYDEAVADCDIFVMMFFTKVGPYTLQEFERAFKGLQEGGRPRIYTYFRNDSILTGDIDEGIKSLLDFKARMKELKHYVTTYRNSEDLLYHFSGQLEKLYGEEGADAHEIGTDMPPLKVGEIALQLGYRQLFGSGAVAAKRLADAIRLADPAVRLGLYQMASKVRRDNWRANKRQMERALPVLEALTRSDPTWHEPFGQLGYALADKLSPDWARAKECLDRAIELRGKRLHEGYWYAYARARCAVKLDPAFGAEPPRPAEAATRESVLEAVRFARRELDADWETLIGEPDSEPLRDWLALNGNPRLR